MMIRGWGRRIAWGGLLSAGLALLCIVAMSVATAYAAGGRVFNPALSLTGGCTVNQVDPVADPGPCPGVPGVDHPNKSFSSPRSVSTDSYGNIYVASFGQNGEGKEGRVDVFDPKGFYIAGSELEVPEVKNIAVDDSGHLYVYTDGTADGKLLRYDPEPSSYEPEAGKIKYEGKPFTISEGSFAFSKGLALDSEGHLFVNNGASISEYGSAAEGNKLIESFTGSILGSSEGIGLAIDKARGRIYASDLSHTKEFPEPTVVRVFELGKPHALLGTIDGSTTPPGKFLNAFPSLAVDEETGHLFVYDGGGAEVVYEFGISKDSEGELHEEYLATIDHELKKQWVERAEIAVDNGENSPNGALNPFGRFLFVPAYPSGTGHAFAFGPPEQCEPEVEGASVTGVTESEAELQVEIEPCGLETSYAFEYTTEESFEEEGFAGAQIAGEGQIPAGLAPVPVSAAAEGLAPGTAYRFRVFAENEEGNDEVEGEFATYPSQPLSPCPNDPLRTGFSALLPDCRAYELVTPPDTNGRSPMGLSHLGTYFASRQASPAGEKVSFQVEGGLIPGSEGTGSLGGDPYLATRGAGGWSTDPAGPDGGEALELLPGSTSPDQGYSFWRTAGGSGSASVEEKPTSYVRYPDGHSALVGRGSLGTDPQTVGRLISEGGGHIIFASGIANEAVQLEPNAPPSGTKAVYDRTADEVTHVVSLLPGSVTPAAGQNAEYQGASLDGKGVAFSIGKKLYLRFDNTETYEAGEEVTFAGIAEGGARIFFIEGGDLFAFDAKAEETIQFTESGDVTTVNVAAEGTAAYFVSPSVLTGGEENPNGDTAQPGEENLYLSREGSISFVATVAERDVEGEDNGNEVVGGLGLWTAAVGPSEFGPPGRLAADPSRTTPDGSALLFESRADLTGYDPEGHAEVYRYDSSGNELDCLSCNPTLALARGEASLQSVSPERFKPEPLNSYAVVANLRADGRRAFFQSTEPLVPGDTDELQDVYEWEARGVGSCTNPGGCVYLISSGHSDRIDYLYAVADSGDDAFFRTSDILLGVDTEHTPSIYDARVEGGFAEKEPPICQGEGCRPSLTSPPVLPTPESGIHEPEGPPTGKHCPKGKRKAKRKGKIVCVKKHHKHHRAGSRKGGAR